MSVNLKGAIDPKKTKHLGPLFPTIDFKVNSTNKSILESRRKNTPAGTLEIGGREYTLTIGELDHLIETCQLAKQVFFQKYRLGV